MFIKTICEELERAIESNERAGASPVKATFAAAAKQCGRDGCGATPGRSCKNYPQVGGCEGCKPDGREIVIKRNNTVVRENCPLCGADFKADACDGYWFFIEGTWEAVCFDCAGPELAALLAAKSRQAAQICEALDAIKAQKIEHYHERQPALFCQVDAFHTGAEDDDGPGERGFEVYGNMTTWELMHGSDVRVLIRATVTKAVAERGLAEISRAIAAGFTTGALEKDEAAEALEWAEVLQRHDADSIPF